MFNALIYIRKLEAVGFERAQAEAQVQLVLDAIEDEVATKSDLSEVRTDIAQFKSEIKADMAEMKADMAEFKSEIKADIAEFKLEVIVKLGAVMVTCTSLAVGILGFLIKF